MGPPALSDLSLQRNSRATALQTRLRFLRMTSLVLMERTTSSILSRLLAYTSAIQSNGSGLIRITISMAHISATMLKSPLWQVPSRSSLTSLACSGMRLSLPAIHDPTFIFLNATIGVWLRRFLTYLRLS